MTDHRHTDSDWMVFLGPGLDECLRRLGDALGVEFERAGEGAVAQMMQPPDHPDWGRLNLYLLHQHWHTPPTWFLVLEGDVSLERQRAAAQKAYAALTEGTDWHVRWSSDMEHDDDNGIGFRGDSLYIAERRSIHGPNMSAY